MKRNFTVDIHFVLIFSVLLFIVSESYGQDRLTPVRTPDNGYEYILYLPEEYNPALQDDWPVLIYLHGGRGITDGDTKFGDPVNVNMGLSSFLYGPPNMIHNKLNGTTFPPYPERAFDEFIVVIPHLPRDATPQLNDQLWDINKVKNVLDHVILFEDVALNRIYFTGISLGAKGVLDFSMANPEIPAAIVPISGTGLLADACNLENIPVWGFHGENDYLKYDGPSDSQAGRWGTKAIVDKINTCSNVKFRANFTLFPYKIHDPEVWDNIYNLSSGYNIFDWLLKHEKGLSANIPPYARITQADQKHLLDQEGRFTTKLNSDAFDSNFGDNVSYTWTLKSGNKDNMSFRTPGGQEIPTPTGTSVFATFTAPDTYVINLEVKDGFTDPINDEIAITIAPSIDDIYVSRLELFSTKNGEFLMELKNGDKINTEQLGDDNFNIRAVLQSTTNVQSVKFSIGQDENFSIVNDGESGGGNSYYMFTNRGGTEWIPDDGEYVIAATPYSDKRPPRTAGITNQIVVYVNVEPPIILPVEFLDINAARLGNKISINWSTASEQGNDFFTIERSPIASDHFESIGTQKGAGDSKELKNYSFTDYAPLAGDAYYRVKQTDFDGKSDYSKIVKVKGSGTFEASLFPNPTERGFMFVRLSTADLYTSVSVNVLDAIGNLVFEDNLAPEKLTQIDGFKLVVGSKLNPGLYFVIIEQGDQKVQRKLIVQ